MSPLRARRALSDKYGKRGDVMLYASAGLLGLVINLIINHDVLFGRFGVKRVPARRPYRRFLIAITLYFVTDIAWGLLYERGLIALTYADTVLYFLTMALSILFWTRYVIDYLQDNGFFGKLLRAAGWVLFIFECVVLLVNFFHPVLFFFDNGGNYNASVARYTLLIAQIVMFLVTAVYALASNRTGALYLRHRSIGLSSLTMALFITLQARFPLLPMYAIGCLLSTCILHSFVLENENEEYRDKLESQLQENIQKGNYYDLLTGLPGMIYFFESVQKKREALVREGGRPAFLYLNLSGLKFYNQNHGFAAGDALLRDFAGLLVSIFGEDNCSRFGQDHFAAFTEADALADRLDRLFRGWQSDRPAILVGVCVEASDGVDISTVYDRAKLACDAIHSTHTSSVQHYDSAMFEGAERHQYITSHLDQAIAEGWIQVYYQPIVRATNGHVCDEEALARWIDPERGFLSPADFIPILEDARLIYKLDLYMVDQVLEKLRRQQEAGLFLVPQSINLSRSDFDMCDIVEEIRRRVDDAGFPRRLITIEITESIVGTDFDFIKGEAQRFRSLGFPVWMDDFGSGYSSLDVLQGMPVDLIKLDMRFMQQFDTGNKIRIILTELVRMAIGLGIDTVCEGVERAEQVEFLREIGCSKLQGYFYTKPIPLAEVFRRYETGIQIGFENPEESAYYDAISRINLYDLSAIANEDDDSFQHYFSTLPMAIIEVQGDRARFTRSNQAYRDFMARIFRLNLATLGGGFEDTPEGPGLAFVEKLRQCCVEGGRTLFDEVMPDGATVHSFMRRIAENPLTGTIAAAVAVLAITGRES